MGNDMIFSRLPLLDFLCTIYQNVEGDIEGRQRAQDSGYFLPPAPFQPKWFVLHNQQVHVGIGTGSSTGVGAKEDDPARICRLRNDFCHFFK